MKFGEIAKIRDLDIYPKSLFLEKIHCMEIIQRGKQKGAKNGKQLIPEYLIYETIAGKPIYRKGYGKVLNKTKTLDDIIASGGIQSEIIHLLNIILFTRLGCQNYRFYSKEAGIHIDPNNNLASDLIIYSKVVLTPDKITTKYVDVPGQVYLEVDIKAELEDMSETGYIRLKTQKNAGFRR